MDRDVMASISKFRDTMSDRAVAAMGALGGAAALSAALGSLRVDLAEEIKMLPNAKIKGATGIIKERTAVLQWLTLFSIKMEREDQPRSDVLPPSQELGEHRPSELGTPQAQQPGPGGRCAAGNIHDKHTSRCACGYDRIGAAQATDIAEALSSVDASAGLTGVAVGEYLASLPAATMTINDAPDVTGTATVSDTLAFLSGATDELFVSVPSVEVPADRYPLSDALDDRTVTPQVAREIRERTETFPIEQGAMQQITNVASAADPFAPIPRPSYGATVVPPGGAALTSTDLLAPVDPSRIPAHLSFSQVTTVADCGAKYRLQRVDQVPQVPQWANVGGKTFHAFVEIFEDARSQPDWSDADMDRSEGGHLGFARRAWLEVLDREIALTEQSSGMTRDSFRASVQGKENEDWWRVEGGVMAQRYIEWRRTKLGTVMVGPDGKPMLEWETTYAVDGVPFKTILDSVWAYDDLAVIRDWKTGSLSPDNRQLCTQAWGLRLAGWQGKIMVQFWDARKGIAGEPFDPFDPADGGMSWDDVRYFVLSGDADRRRPILSARPSDFCGGCSVAYACPIMRQRKAPK